MALAFTYLLVFVAFSFGMTHIMDEKTLALQNTTWLWLNITNEPSGKAYMDFKTKNLPFVRPLFFYYLDRDDENDYKDIGSFVFLIGKLMVNLFWVILDPDIGYPDIRHENGREMCAYAMLMIYHVLVIIILLNLAITLMNSTIQKFQNRQQLYWKCELTSVYMEFFDCPSKLYLPMPFSIILVFWTLLFLPIWKLWRFCFRTKKEQEDSTYSSHLSPSQMHARRKHSKLMQELIMRLIKKRKKNRKK